MHAVLYGLNGPQAAFVGAVLYALIKSDVRRRLQRW